MKTVLPNALMAVLLVAVVGFLGYALAQFGGDHAEGARPPADIRGTFQVREDTRPRLAIRFLGNGEAQMLFDGEVRGAMCHYKIEGDRITLTHSCGVAKFTMREGGLIEERLGLTYERIAD